MQIDNTQTVPYSEQRNDWNLKNGKVQTFQPPSHGFGGFGKQAQKNLEIRASNLETSKLCVK